MLILNVLYYKEEKMSKFMYKTKLFAIVRSLIIKKKSTLSDSASISCTKSFQVYLLYTLIYFKVNNSSIFLNQLLENNDIDLLFTQISVYLSNSNHLSAHSSDFLLGSLFTSLNKLENLIKNEDLLASNLGLQNQIQRQFEAALKIRPRSFQLWFYYFKFESFFHEIKRSENEEKRFRSRVLSIYYQSIRNLPNYKVSSF